MKRKVYPIIVTTLEALEETVKGSCHVIYVDEDLYHRFTTQIQNTLCDHGFVMAQNRGKHGFFFLQTRGEYQFDPTIHYIYDPHQIL